MLKTVYEAQTGIEAHMVANLLEQSGIAAQVHGEYLQGGIGDLPVAGLVRVRVDELDYDRARQVVEDWDESQPPLRVADSEKRSYPLVAFAAGLVLGAIMAWGFCTQLAVH